MQAIFSQVTELWHTFKPFQRIALIVTAFVIAIALSILFFSISSTNYVPLFSADRMQQVDVQEVRAYLEGAEIPYKLKGESLILVPQNREHQIRMELASYGLPKIQTGKGYDLFDSTTWIKGEKELQILEMRALKGQLEEDIAQFTNIRTANVILDIAPPRPFGGSMYKTKASVILNLRPGARLSNQELRAITYHISGAVRGLSPNMVAISDTTGRLYQAIDPDGDLDTIRSSEISVEEHIKAKIDGMLATILGYDHFYSTVQVSMNRNRMVEERNIKGKETNSSREFNGKLMEPNNTLWSLSKDVLNLENSPGLPQQNQNTPSDHIKISSNPGKIETISAGIMIDRNAVTKMLEHQGIPADKVDAQIERLKQDLQNQIGVILKGYNVPVHESVEIVPFEQNLSTASKVKTPDQTILIAENDSPTKTLVTIITLAAIALCWSLMRMNPSSLVAEKQASREKSLEDMIEGFKVPKKESIKRAKGKMEVRHVLEEAEASQLALFLEHESPKTIAMMFYYLDPSRSAEILTNLPTAIQVRTLIALGELEKLTPESLKNLFQANEEVLGSPIGEDFFNPSRTTTIVSDIMQQLDKGLQTTLTEKVRQEREHNKNLA